MLHQLYQESDAIYSAKAKLNAPNVFWVHPEFGTFGLSDTGNNYASLQDAIDDATASTLIIVEPHGITSNITIDKDCLIYFKPGTSMAPSDDTSPALAVGNVSEAIAVKIRGHLDIIYDTDGTFAIEVDDDADLDIELNDLNSGDNAIKVVSGTVEVQAKMVGDCENGGGVLKINTKTLDGIKSSNASAVTNFDAIEVTGLIHCTDGYVEGRFNIHNAATGLLVHCEGGEMILKDARIGKYAQNSSVSPSVLGFPIIVENGGKLKLNNFRVKNIDGGTGGNVIRMNNISTLITADCAFQSASFPIEGFGAGTRKIIYAGTTTMTMNTSGVTTEEIIDNKILNTATEI